MANIIVATEEQIQEAVFNAVSKFFSGNQLVAPSPVRLLLNGRTSNWFPIIAKITLPQSAFRNVSNVNAKIL